MAEQHEQKNGAERVKSITRDTLLPLGVVISMLGVAFLVGSDRQAALEGIKQNTRINARQDEQIEQIDEKLDRMNDVLRRIEIAVTEGEN